MKRMLFCFVLGAAVGAAGCWYFLQGGGRGELEHARDSLKETLGDLSVSNITEELARSGAVVREKARATTQTIADSATSAKITAAIKARLLAEPGLPAMAINVDTTDGVVTLSGKVNSPDQVARAVKVALEVDGVRKVFSTLQVTPAEAPKK